MNAISIKDLKFSYRGGAPVLDVPSLEIKSGETVFLFGPSGSGKTTLLSLIAGILPPTSGRVDVLGSDLGSMSQGARDHLRGNRIGYIFQMFNLLPYLTITENILLPCRLNPKRREGISDIEGEARRLTERLGVSPFAEKKVSDLSVGQQQRVAAARALLGNPELIIADEPTSALDTDHREQFLQLLFENTKPGNATVLFVSHDRSLSKLFDRSISLPEVNRAVGVHSEPGLKKADAKRKQTKPASKRKR